MEILSEQDSSAQYETPARRVRDFLAEELDMAPEKINLTSRLRQDLKITAPDAADILESFSLTFGIDIESFRINDYFSARPTPHPAFAVLLWLFGNAKPLKTLRVTDLVRAFDTGKLKT